MCKQKDMNQKYYSIKQMADMLGTSKQRVYRCIKTNHISEAHHDTVKGNTVLMYSNADFLRIKGMLEGDSESSEIHREAHHEPHREAVSDTLIDTLLKQLAEKDKQIDYLNQRLAENQKLLDQEQQLHLRSQQRLLELEDKIAQESTVDPPEQTDASSDRRPWWKRFFG